MVFLVVGALLFATPLPRALHYESSTRLAASDGTVLYEALSPAQARAASLPLERTSPHLITATIHGEDHRFRMHSGIDPLAVLRAAWLDVKAGRLAYGGSTLTQQLARMLSPAARGWWPKLSEAWMALVLEAKLSKDEILGHYLSRAPYGGTLVGVEAAARSYFDKPAADLSLGEASLLSVLPRSPNRYDLRRGGLEAALRRRAHVLHLMLDRGAIGADDLQRALDEPVVLAPLPSMRAPHAVHRVLAALPPTGRPDAVHTTLDPALQERAEILVRDTVEELRARGVRQAAALVVEVPGGRVRAYVGSADFFDDAAHGQVDGVQARRSPGSTLKPFVYGAALDEGMTAATLLADLERGHAASRGQYRPRNFDEREHGPVRLREALASSYNLAAVDLASRLGPGAMLGVLQSFGFSLSPGSPDELGLGMVLGGVDVSLWEIATAYLAIARYGSRIPLTLVEGGASESPRMVLGRAAAYLIIDILSDDVARASSFGRHSALHLPFAAAVKTGTSKDFRDNWTVGFSSRFLVATWAGDFEGRSMHGVSGITGAGALWHKLMRVVHASGDPPPFARPRDVVTTEVCALSGALPTRSCPRRIDELFRRGTEPAHPCRFHEKPGVLQLPSQFVAWARTAGLDARPLSDELQIVQPADGAVFQLSGARSEAGSGLELWVTGPANEAMELLVDGKLAATGQGAVRASWRGAEGQHVVEAVSGSNRARSTFTLVR